MGGELEEGRGIALFLAVRSLEAGLISWHSLTLLSKAKRFLSYTAWYYPRKRPEALNGRSSSPIRRRLWSFSKARRSRSFYLQPLPGYTCSLSNSKI